MFGFWFQLLVFYSTSMNNNTRDLKKQIPPTMNMLPSNSRFLSLIILTTGLLSRCPLRATAQQTNATCLPQYNWMDNSQNQNPCVVASYTAGVCSNGQCACAICQNASSVNWPSWSVNCSTAYVGYPFGIPNGTAVPQWAYQDSSDDFNVVVAQEVGDSPESVAPTAPATTSSTTASPTPSPSSFTSSATLPSTQPLTTSSISSASSALSPSTQKGAIVGGVVGGVGFVVAAAVTWFFICRRQKPRLPRADDDE
ncbi:hypothetical protein EDD15DRAFT_653171 [Pisolithus albus]|nr:hypothetical protein EDD15DRAFT_653171 [Pisolithus albus]